MRRMINLRRWAVTCGAMLLVFSFGTLAFAQPAANGKSAVRALALQALLGSVKGDPSMRGAVSQESPRIARTKKGHLRFVGAPPSAYFTVAPDKRGTPEKAAEAFLQQWRNLFIKESPAVRFDRVRVKTQGVRSYVRFKQTYADLPVFGAEIIVQVNAGGQVACTISDIMRDAEDLDMGKLSILPGIDEPTAQKKATEWLLTKQKGLRLQASSATLMIYDPSVVGESGPVRLIWKTIVGNVGPSVVKEVVLVDAHTGEIAFQYPLIHDAKYREIYDANNSTSDPGILVRSEDNQASGITDADLVYDYLGDTYDFYFNEHGRDSINDAGYTLSATVRYCYPGEPCPFANAFWNGTRMYFGDGYTADDVVAHELTHGVTDYESALIYANQSGAINESFSDMWGEWVDLVNGSGTDTIAVRWLHGEDIQGSGANRDMADPPVFADPDRMGSPYWYTGSGDNGGVHTNSGVGNKLCYLLTDGDTFNGYTISGMGISQAADLFYECQTNLLTSSSDYADLYFSMTQAAVNLGWSQAERDNVEQASQSVEIKPLPEVVSNFRAFSSDGDPSMILTWTNPTQSGLQSIIIRRNTGTYPIDPTDGTLVYEGLDTSTLDGPLTIGTEYFYSAWAYYGGADYSAVANSRAIAGVDPVDYFTELFDSNDNDLDYMTLTLTPDGSANFYSAGTESATTFPTDPLGGVLLNLFWSDYEWVLLSGGEQVSLYGVTYSDFYVGSSGYITFTAGDYEYFESTAAHFSLPRISALFDELEPGYGGTVSWKQLTDRVAVTFENVPEFYTSNSNNFQIEMFYDGTIRLTWLQIDANDALAGLSQGLGTPLDFVESDLSAYLPLPPMTVSIPASATEGDGILSGQGTVTVPQAPDSFLIVYLVSDNTSEVDVPNHVAIPAGGTTTTFDLTIIDDALLDGTQTATITASASGYMPVGNTIQVNDNETAALSVIVPANVTEGAGVLIGQGTVTVSAAVDSDVEVTLTSDDATEVTVPASVIISLGQASAVFDLTVVDDTEIDEQQTATVTASVTGWIPGSDVIIVADNETYDLTVTVPSNVLEGDGVLSSVGTVSISGTLTSDLIVTLSSDDTSEMTVPASVPIPAGQISAAFDLTVIDDPDIDGTQIVNITAMASGWTSDSSTIAVSDNDPGELQFSSSAYPVNEDIGTAIITVVRTGNSSGTFTIDYTTSDNSAIDGSDYLAEFGTLTFYIGDSAKTFSISILDDIVFENEGVETLNLSLSNATGGVSLGSQSTSVLNITDNDATKYLVDGNFLGAKEVFSGDIDGDGDLDVIGASFSGDEIVWWENTDGSGTAWSKHVIGGNSNGANTVFAADIDSDGDLDVIGATYYGDGIAWWENADGLGISWVEHVVDSIPSWIESIFTADIDGDGDLDVVGAVVSSGGEIVWWENADGLGTSWVKRVVDGNFDGANSVYVVDVDGDGDLDVFGASYGSASPGPAYGVGEIAWWENIDGVGTSWSKFTVNGYFKFGRSVYATDMDGDSDIDILGANSNTITLWENTDGSGTTWSERTVDDNFSSAFAVEAADVDGDGDMDILGAAYSANQITWWENSDGIGASWIEHAVDNTFLTARSVKAADVDGDGDLDIIGAADMGDQVAWWENPGSPILVDVPQNATEGDGVLTDQGTVSVGYAPAGDLVVNLISSDTSEVAVPSTVTILAGQTSATFDLTILDDCLLNGTRAVTITASASGYKPGVGTIQVLDDDMDSDGDGIADSCDNCLLNANADQTDTDGDGLGNVCDQDDDNDGITDDDEISIYGTNPLLYDTDNDTYGDGDEIALLSDPLDTQSIPEFATGDLAPRGAPDGVVDIADALLSMRIATGQIAPTPLDMARADVAPLGNPDGLIDVADVLLIMRKATGLTSF